jgi:hypothetical protein
LSSGDVGAEFGCAGDIGDEAIECGRGGPDEQADLVVIECLSHYTGILSGIILFANAFRVSERSVLRRRCRTLAGSVAVGSPN